MHLFADVWLDLFVKANPNSTSDPRIAIVCIVGGPVRFWRLSS